MAECEEGSDSGIDIFSRRALYRTICVGNAVVWQVVFSKRGRYSFDGRSCNLKSRCLTGYYVHWGFHGGDVVLKSHRNRYYLLDPNDCGGGEVVVM